MTVNDKTVFCLAGVRANFPVLRRGGDEHFARGGAGLAQGQPRASDAPAAACAEVVDLRIRWCLFDVHLLPVDAQLFGENHRQRCVDTLAHLRLAKYKSDPVIGRDTHPGVERIWSFLLLILRVISERAGRQMETNHQRSAARSTLLQEISAVYNGSSCHGTPQNGLRESLCEDYAAECGLPVIVFAARWMALRMR